jgi:hypothetical protein
MKLYRQGDVLIRQVESLPNEAIAKDNSDEGRVVLAYGEVTGHAHAIALDEAVEYTMEKAGAAVRRFLSVISGATVKHEEHAAIPLPPGVYEIVQQREYTPEAIRNVTD